jgi:sugar-specific transcriptional regulator TrmB
MAIEEKEIAALRRLGLTDYESRIYLALIKMGPLKASEVSFFGQVPRTKSYGAIKELEQKGLVRVTPGKPETYAPRSPNEVLVPLVSKLNIDLKESEEVVQSLSVGFESSKFVKRGIPKESSEFWQIDGRQNVFSKMSQILGEATKAINYCTSAAGLIRAYKVHAEILDKAKKRGAIVRVLAPVSSENTGVASEIGEVVSFKNLDRPFAENFVTVDARELVVIEAKPEDLRTDRGSDSAIWTTNRLLVELHEQLFDRVWNSLSGSEKSRK